MRLTVVVFLLSRVKEKWKNVLNKKNDMFTANLMQVNGKPTFFPLLGTDLNENPASLNVGRSYSHRRLFHFIIKTIIFVLQEKNTHCVFLLLSKWIRSPCPLIIAKYIIEYIKKTNKKIARGKRNCYMGWHCIFVFLYI